MTLGISAVGGPACLRQPVRKRVCDVALHGEEGTNQMSITSLMLGWEFPPLISGGLGTACHGLTKAMSRRGMRVTFVLPRHKPMHFAEMGDDVGVASVKGMRNVRVRPVESSLRAYGRFGPKPIHPVSAAIEAELSDEPAGGPTPYGPSLEQEVFRYAQRVMRIAERERFAVIHAHDWMTFPAGIAVAACSRKPLIVQVHSTEFDRTANTGTSLSTTSSVRACTRPRG